MYGAKAKLISRIPQAEKSIRQQAEEVVLEGANDAATLARQFAPVLTGELQESIHVYRNTKMNAEVRASADHAAAVEFGTMHSPAQPFLRPAAEAVKPKVIRRLRRMKVL